MSSTKGKIIVFFVIFISVYFFINIIITIVYINNEKRESLRILLTHTLRENYIHVKDKQESSDLNFLYNIPHMISSLEQSGARAIEFFFSEQKYAPKHNEIAADLLLENGRYLNVKSSDREIRRHIFESAIIMLGLDFVFLLILIIIGVYFIRRLLSPLSDIAAKCKKYDNDYFEIHTKNASSEILQLESALNMLTRRFRKLRAKDKEYFEQATHELKTPLAIIKARVDSYERDTCTKEQFVKDVNNDIERLYLEIKSMLYFNIFDFSQKEYFNVRAKIEREIERLDVLLRERGLGVDVSGDDFYIYAQEKLFAKMFMAIFENAIIYAKSHSTIRIVLESNSLCIVNERGRGANLFNSKLGITILEKLSKEMSFTFDISKDSTTYRVCICFE